jgi:CO/xanthine dehydrogenase Mo-binding subunit
VDPDTGAVTVLGFAIAQDAGFAINPLSVEGQMQGRGEPGTRHPLSGNAV